MASFINTQTGNLKLAQKLLGHSTIDMTADVYTHTSAEAEREGALAVERAIYGDLFVVVPKIANRNDSAALELWRLDLQLKEKRALRGLASSRPWLRGLATYRI